MIAQEAITELDYASEFLSQGLVCMPKDLGWIPGPF